MKPSYRNAIIGAVLGAGFTTIAGVLSGASLGLLLCGTFAAMVLIPLLDEASSLKSRVFVAYTIVNAISVVWLIVSLFSAMTILDVVQAHLIFLSISAMLFGLRLIRIHPHLIAYASIAWLASPVLLAHSMNSLHGDRITSFVTRYHPLFALNRIVIDQGAWTSGDFAYQHLTPLGQDVSYILPEDIWPCVMAHAILAVGCAMIFAASGRRDQTAIARC